MTHNIILLVEDTPDDVEMTRRFFSRSNIANRKPVDFLQFNEAVRQLSLHRLVFNVPQQAGGA